MESLQTFLLLFVLNWLEIQAYPKSSLHHNLRSQLRCSYTSVQRGVVPQGGFSKDYVEHVGIVKDVKECVRSCCGSRDCDMAFMLANHCYRISCIRNPKRCEPTKARGKNWFVAKLVKLERKPIDDPLSLTFHMKSHKDELQCTHSPISTNVTLRGGVKAGKFSDLGEVESMHMCTALCCAKPTCDLAFMIGETCVAVECVNEEMCQTVRARPTGFSPKISYIRRREINKNVKKAKIASTHLPAPTYTEHSITKPEPPAQFTHASNRTSCIVTLATPNITLRHGLDGENAILLGNVDSIEKCIELSCNNIGGNTAFLLGKRCYVVQCPPKGFCDTIPLGRKGMTSVMAYLQKPKSRLDYDGIDDKTANDMRNTLCSGKRILKNHAIYGGLEAGHFTKISTVNSIENCTMLCCREKRCDMAVMLNGACFVGSCRNKEKCKPVRLASKAGIVSHLGFKIALEDEMTQQDKHVVTAPNTHKIVSYRLPAPTILKTSTCSAEKIFHNVTLIGGMKAANITSLGKASNMQECIGMSCDYGQGDLVLMLEKNCYTVKCVNERVCQTAPAQPSKFFSRVAYLKWGSTINETDLTLDQTESKRYPRCSRSHILHNHTLRGGLRAGNFSVISQVDSIENCAAICCNEENCDLALMLDEVCYIGDCANPDLCVPVLVTEGSRRTSQIAFISNPRKAADNELTDYSMIYILVGSIAMVISVTGLMWSVCLCMTRKRLNKDKDRLSMVDKDGDSLQDMQMYSPSHWSKESGLHSLGGSFTHNGPLFLSDSESEDEDDFTALEEYKKHRAENEHTAQPPEGVSPNGFTEKNYIDMMNAINQKVRKSMQNL